MSLRCVLWSIRNFKMTFNYSKSNVILPYVCETES